jgi:prefoldin alpha subunit
MDQAFQEKYFQLQQIDANMKQFEQQLQQVDQQVQELSVVRDSLIEIPMTKQDTEILIPLGNGIFTKGVVKNRDDVIVCVGSNIAVKKSFKDAYELIDKQILELKGIENELASEMQNMSLTARSLEAELNELSKKER